MLYAIGQLVYYKNETFKLVEYTGRTDKYNHHIVKIVSLRTNEVIEVIENSLDIPPVHSGNICIM